MIKLRPYQMDIIEKARQHMQAGHRAVLIQSPCGSGKTCLTAEMLRLASQKGKTAWFTVHRKELLDQAVETFSLVGLKVGIIAAGYPMAKKLPVQVCSVQTLVRRLKYLKPSDLCITDECHHQSSKTWCSIYEHCKSSYHIGLTATPWRLDGTGLRPWYPYMIKGPEMQWLIGQKYLSKYKIYAPTTVNTSGIHTRMGDFVKSELAMALDKPSITGDAIKHYLKYCNGCRAIVFCVSVEHSKHVAGQFIANGIQAEHIDGEISRVQRDQIINRFRKGQTRILTNVDIVGEGFDLPAVEASIMLRPTQSLGLFIQQAGRCLRPCEGKETAIILDHAGNTLRHGLPDDEREWSLDGVNKVKKGEQCNISVRICPKCFAAQRSGNPICEFCGYEFEVKYRKVDENEGDLTEIDILKVRKTRRMEQGRCKEFDDLVELGRRRGYKRPFLWAKYVLKARKQKQEQEALRG